jgi:LAS superfamily LD-carboxypeptidase LdcB
LIVSFLFADTIISDEVRNAHNSENKQLDTLISQYENTYLLQAEANHFQYLKLDDKIEKNRLGNYSIYRSFSGKSISKDTVNQMIARIYN